MKAVFFGTPDIAASCLERLLSVGVDVIYTVTRADKPKGRGYKVEYSPVKQVSLDHGIPVYQPVTLRDGEAYELLSSLGADVFITVAYGRILPSDILAIPPMGCINMHASLLPYLRGASPINRALMNGDKVGGVTVMYMDEGLDTGDIVLQKTVDIPDDMDFGTYYDVITNLGCDALEDYVNLAANGQVTRTPQDHSLATYAAKVEKEETLLDFGESADDVYNKIRGLSPSPCAYTFLAGKRVKVYKAEKGSGNGRPGSILAANKKGIEIAVSGGSIIITELQPEGKGRMTASAFLAGNKVVPTEDAKGDTL